MEGGTVIKTDHKNIEDFLKALGVKENHLYEAEIKCTPNNVEHRAFLFVGFLTGGYCTVYTNSYDTPVNLKDVYSVKLIREISQIKDYI